MKIYKIVILFLFVPFINSPANSITDFIGLHKEEIKTVMKEQMDDFNLDNTTINKTYNYLKYVDYLGQQTILYFLDENDICIASKWICDYSLLDEKTNTLNEKYQKSGEDTWTYEGNNRLFNIKLEKEDWFFAIVTRPKK